MRTRVAPLWTRSSSGRCSSFTVTLSRVFNEYDLKSITYDQSSVLRLSEHSSAKLESGSLTLHEDSYCSGRAPERAVRAAQVAALVARLHARNAQVRVSVLVGALFFVARALRIAPCVFSGPATAADHRVAIA